MRNQLLNNALWPLALAGLIGSAAVPALAQQAAAPAAAATTTTDAAAAPAATTAAAGTPVAYPGVQARKGGQVFEQSCAGCHGDQLQGMMENPPLSGAAFQADYFGQPVSNLFDFISQNMPLDAPGSLQPQQYADIIAYILSKNGVAATDSAPNLPGDSAALAAMTLPAAAQ